MMITEPLSDPIPEQDLSKLTGKARRLANLKPWKKGQSPNPGGRPKQLELDPEIREFLHLKPTEFFKKSSAERKQLFKQGAELLLLRSEQDMLKKEVIHGKSATPAENASFGTRFDKIARSDDAGFELKLPAQMIAAYVQAIQTQHEEEGKPTEGEKKS